MFTIIIILKIQNGEAFLIFFNVYKSFLFLIKIKIFFLFLSIFNKNLLLFIGSVVSDDSLHTTVAKFYHYRAAPQLSLGN